MASSLLTGSRALLINRCVLSCLSAKQWWWTSACQPRLSTTITKWNNSLQKDESSTHNQASLSALKEHLYSTSYGSKSCSKQFDDGEKLNSLVKTTSQQIRLYSINEILSLLRCVKKVQYRSPQLLDSIMKSFIERSSELTLEDAATVVRLYKKFGLPRKADELSMLYSEQLLQALTEGEYVDPGIVVALSDKPKWTPAFVATIQNYVLTHSKEFSFQSLTEILTVMMRKNWTTYHVLHECADTAETLINALPKSRYSEMGNLFWVYGKCVHYHPGLFDTVEKVLQAEDKCLSPFCVTTVAWSCAKVRYYHPGLMESIAQYSLRNLSSFTFHDISSLVYTFGALNHPHKQLFLAVTERFVRAKGTRNIEQAHWVFVWACLVLEVYDTRVLSKVLSAEFIEASTRINDYKVKQPLQMSIALNYERPDLGFALPNPPSMHKWGVCFPTMQGVDPKYIQLATVLKLGSYQTRDRSRTFVENVLRALYTILGGSQFVNREAISLSGYVIDFEVILNQKNEPILIPKEWNSRPKDVVLRSIGFSDRVTKSSSSCKLDGNSLIEIAKQSEISYKNNSGQLQQHSGLRWSQLTENKISLTETNKEPVKLVNLASDWGTKFESPQEKIIRKVAIEADGLPHFACNCDHVLGPTVLKHRQLRALGWDVVQIPFTEWRSLMTGDDHAQYLNEKIITKTSR